MGRVKVERIELKDSLEVSLPDGSLVRIRPGPYGKGIAVIPIDGKDTARVETVPTGGRGRRPRASTVALRDLLSTDKKDGRDRPNQEYVDWMLAQDETLSLPVARQIVYRERRRV